MNAPDLPASLDAFAAAVRRNCHIADARHARELTMCIYLLEMREFYRWETGLAFGVSPPQAEVGAWLTEREALWESLEGQDFAQLDVDGASRDPFDAGPINAALLPLGFYYGAGHGRFGKPHFFLARLHSHVERDGLRVFVCDREYARDMTTMPAASQPGAIVVRREALRRLLWEQAEAWDAKRNPGALQLALGVEGGGTLAQAIERLVETETETLILHELGEHAAGARLGAAWEEMLVACRSKRAEILARAVRDNLADCSSTLPALLDRRAEASLHLWFANFKGMRLSLHPALRSAYERWREAGDEAGLRSAAESGRAHWLGVARRFLEAFVRRGPAFDEELVRLSHDVAEIALPG